MFNIPSMTLGEIIEKILVERGILQADLIRKMQELAPENNYSNLQVSVSNTIKRKSKSSKYISLIAKALDLSVDALLEWKPKNQNKVEQKPKPYGNVWPFGNRVTPDEYEGLGAEQKEVIISRIRTFLDDNDMKSKGDSAKKEANN